MAPPPSPPAKKSSSFSFIYLLIGIIIAVVVISGVIGYLVYRQSTPSQSPNATSLPLFLDPKSLIPSVPSTTTVSTPESTVPSTTATVTSTQPTSVKQEEVTASPETTVVPFETTLPEYRPSSSTAAPEPLQSTAETLEETTTNEPAATEVATTESVESSSLEVQFPVDTQSLVDEEQNEMVAQCSAIVAEKVTCAKTKEDIRVLSINDFRPLHYHLNLSVKSVQPPVIEGSAKIFFQLVQQGKQISINGAAALRGMDDVSVVDCSTGKTICVSKTVYESREEVLSLLLEDTVAAGSNLRIDFNAFTSLENRDALYAQVPPRWHRGAPTMLGLTFGPSTARKIFPCFDHPAYKAPLDLCVSHWPSSKVRSNADAVSSANGTTCFATTAPLNTQQYSFTAFEKAESIITNSTTTDASYIPSIEIVFSLNKNFKREKHSWIYNEAAKVFSTMTRWSQFSFPLTKLSLFSSPISDPAHSALGIITLQDRLVEYPSYTMAHVSLIRAVIGQWLGGIVAGPAEHECFQDSLITYLEWKLNEEFSFVNRSRSGEVANSRPRDLAKDGQTDARMIRSPQGSNSCSERFVAVFYSLDETFGQNTVTNMVKEMFHNFAFGVTKMEDWTKAVVVSSGNPDAGQMLSEWFSRTTRPVLRAVVRSQTVEIEQLTTSAWTVPLEIGGSSGVFLVTINQTHQSVPFSSDDYVILDPARKSTAMIIYDADAYLRIVRCWDASSCPAPRPSLRAAVQDMGAVLLADLMPVPEAHDVIKWTTFYKFVVTHRLLEGDAACCVAYALRQPADVMCTWVVQDTCPKIRLISMLAKS